MVPGFRASTLVCMTSPAALVLHPDTGGTVHLVEPIPDTAVITLPMLLSCRVREWVLIPTADVLEVAGHSFVVGGWVEEDPPGLLVAHACCRADTWP